MIKHDSRTDAKQLPAKCICEATAVMLQQVILVREPGRFDGLTGSQTSCYSWADCGNNTQCFHPGKQMSSKIRIEKRYISL